MNPVLNSPSHAIIGTTDIDRATAEWTALGFTEQRQAELPAVAAHKLYGLESATRERRLSISGVDSGWIRLVETPHAHQKSGPYDHRPIALDLYTRNIEQSIELSRRQGAEIVELVEYELGPLAVKEIETIWSDGVVIVFLEVNQHRPSLLDRDSERLHSELHSLVWAVPSIEEASRSWLADGGLKTLVATEIRGPVISKLMQLPRPDVPVGFALYCDHDERPARLELLEFLEDEGSAVASGPLRGGLHAIGLQCNDVDGAKEQLPSCEIDGSVRVDTNIHRAAKGARGTAIGGVRFELWQEQ